jgi:parallel beta-helix repeat protein
MRVGTKELEEAFFMRTNVALLGVAVMLAALNTVLVEAATTTSGVITGSETWSGTVHVTGDVTVAPTGSLTILPGTRIESEPRADDQIGGTNSSRIELIVDGGALIAIGEESAPIVFTAAKLGTNALSEGDWYGLRISHGANVTLRHCTIEYGTEGLNIAGATPLISHCIITKNTGNGVSLSSSATFSDCTINQNLTGVWFQGAVTCVLSNCTVSENTEGGIYAHVDSGSTSVIANTTISYNGPGHDGSGVESEHIVISGSTVADNQGNGMFCRTAVVTDCRIMRNADYGLCLYTGGNTKSTALDCVVVGNQRGGLIVAWVGGFLEAERCLAANNGGTGIGTEASAGQVTVRSCLVIGNAGSGVFAGVLSVTNCLIQENKVGVEIRSSAAKVEGITGNDIYGNTEFELKNSGSAAVVADGNYWGEPTTTELSNHVANLTKIYDSRDDAKVGQVVIRTWSESSQSRPAVPPGIITEPLSAKLMAGSLLTLSVSALGPPPLSYQWRLNGTNLPGATNATYTIASVGLQDGGRYTVVVANEAGAVTSDPAEVAVIQTVAVGYGIGLNCGADEPNGTRQANLNPADWAGVPEARQQNWNNLERASGSKSNLVAHKEGAAVSTTTLATWNSSVTWCSTGRGEDNGKQFMPGTPDHTLMLGYIDTGDATTTTVTITNLPTELTTEGYDVYVYMLGGVAGRGGSYRILNAATREVLRPYLMGTAVANPTDYSQDLGVDHTDQGTYLAFTNLTASSIVVEATTKVNPLGIGTVPRAPINAIQLVARKAPAGEEAPLLLAQPTSQTVSAATDVTFTVVAAGTEPLAYQWRLNSNNLVEAGQFSGVTTASLSISNVQTTNEGSYDVVVSNSAGAVTSTPPAVLNVLVPPTFTKQPQSQRVLLGSSLTLSVSASGAPPLTYQWRLNGANIPGATNATYTIASVRLEDSGSYTVMVANEAGAVTSDVAEITIELPLAPAGDNFASRISLSGTNGVLTSTNRSATVEPGEPKHAGKEGGKSVWYTWRASANGIATFRTTGSSFDTLLGVYTGTAVNSLTAVGGDDDRGGYLTSEVRFNAVAGTDYQVAVDGFGGAEGDFILSWQLEPTAQTVPVITSQPASQAVLATSNVVFQVAATGDGLSYQWYFNGAKIEGAATSALARTNVQKADVGAYTVWVSNATLQSVESLPAFLEMVETAKELTQDKLEDLVVGVSGLMLSSLDRSRRTAGFPSVSVGSLGSQILNNLGATTQAGEPNPWSAIGGASRWLRVKAAEDGVMVIDTVGSEIDTLLAVYTGTSIRDLTLVAADDNGAPDGVRSQVRFPAHEQVEYLIDVDGVGGAQGVVNVNWRMGLGPVVVNTVTNVARHVGGPLLLHADAVAPTSETTYQWRRGTKDLAGATNATLSISWLTESDAGTYSVLVCNHFGTVVKEVATVAVASGWQLRCKHDGSGGAFRFWVAGETDQGIVLETTTDFLQWDRVYTNPPNAAFEFLDPAATNLLLRFYRAHAWP